MQHVDTTTLFNQYQSWLERVTNEAETDLEQMKTDFETYLNNLKTTFSSDFTTWFRTIQDILDENTAGHLLNLINTKGDKKKTYNIEIDTTNWTAQNTKTITIEGIEETDIVNLYPVWSENKDLRLQEKEEYNKISLVKSGENLIKLICDEETPTIKLNARIEVVY